MTCVRVRGTRMTNVGTFPIGDKHQEPNHPFGLQGIQAALLSHHVQSSGTHQLLSMTARNRASSRALTVVAHILFDGSATLDAAQSDIGPRTPIRPAKLRVFLVFVMLDLHPYQEAESHLVCTRPPDFVVSHCSFESTQRMGIWP
jgi:hypothetical protein